MREWYPQISPYKQLRLEVGGGHSLYLEESGNADGVPVVFLHGGPGSGCNENHRRYFDPRRYRVVIFDQRGCNRSTPRGGTTENSTPDLIDDMERIRTLLGIRRWLVYGGSWGATLGLLYAESCPEQVLGLILRGVFLARQRDLDWFTRDGANRLFPDQWGQFLDALPESARGDPVRACYEVMHGDDAVLREKVARAWVDWSGRVVTFLMPPMPASGEAPDVARMVDEVRIETHYAMNRYFISENQILDQLDRLPKVPVYLVHGRRDLTCPLESSWTLHRAIPASELTIVADGGHLASEPSMIDALVHATDAMAKRLRP